MTLERLLGTELPIIQAPMAGAQGSALAAAVSNASGLGSLPRSQGEPAALAAQMDKPFNERKGDGAIKL